MDWSPQQDRALRDCAQWLRSRTSGQVYYLAGFAGTGKTTLAKHLVGTEAPGRWLFASFTGKASHVLRQKGCDGATTIHSLIYRPNGESLANELKILDLKISSLIARIDKFAEKEALAMELQGQLNKLTKMRRELSSDNRPRFALWANSPLADFGVDGIVVDEVSMVDERLGKDLESFGKKILVLGDPAQLPPIGSGGYYTKRTPDTMLTEVHRHAKESGILRLATLIREGGKLSDFSSTVDAEVVSSISREDLAMAVLGTDQVLVGLNETRRAMNRRHRELLGRTDPCPVFGDRLVCLRNDHDIGIFNGSQWKVVESDCDLDFKSAMLEITSEDDNRILEVESWLHHMLGCPQELEDEDVERRSMAEFDWSYSLTVHKAQGSQWNDVVLFDQSKSFRGDARRWLYTGATRAAKRLMIVT